MKHQVRASFYDPSGSPETASEHQSHLISHLILAVERVAVVSAVTLLCTPMRRTIRGMASTPVKEERLAVRVTARQKQTIERAAAVLGRNVTEFSVQAITERAEEVLTDRHVFNLSQAQWDEFVAQLEEPARPVPELVALLHRPSLFDE